MNANIQRRKQHRPASAVRLRALFACAVFGSLVFCAALAPDSFAQESPARPQTPEAKVRPVEENVEKFPTVNTKPFSELLQQGKQMRDAGELDLSGNMEIEVEGDREEDGRLTNVVATGMAASNLKLLSLAKDFIAALSDSKVLSGLKGVSHLKMKIGLNDNLSVRVLGETASAEEAAKLSNGYKSLILMGTYTKRGKDEEAIFKSIQIASQDKQIVLTFSMPRKEAGELLSKLIKKHEPTPATPPN
ncbi:MAG TPA: hypothetical protein VF527_00860 [Pyrinomonadaceae bacterium]|jgi:hypothetical protein